MSKPLPRHTVVAAGLICAAVASVAVATASSASATVTRTSPPRPTTSGAVVSTPVKTPVKTPAKPAVKAPAKPAVKTPARTVVKTPAPVTVSIAASGPVTARTKFQETLRGVARRGSTPLAAQVVELVERSGTSSRWVNVTHQRTAAKTGSVTFHVKQTQASEQYRLVVLGAGGRVVAESVAVIVKRA